MDQAAKFRVAILYRNKPPDLLQAAEGRQILHRQTVAGKAHAGAPGIGNKGLSRCDAASLVTARELQNHRYEIHRSLVPGRSDVSDRPVVPI